MLCTYAVSHATTSGTAATGVAKYYRHVQTGLCGADSSSKPGERLKIFYFSCLYKGMHIWVTNSTKLFSFIPLPVPHVLNTYDNAYKEINLNNLLRENVHYFPQEDIMLLSIIFKH